MPTTLPTPSVKRTPLDSRVVGYSHPWAGGSCCVSALQGTGIEVIHGFPARECNLRSFFNVHKLIDFLTLVENCLLL